MLRHAGLTPTLAQGDRDLRGLIGEAAAVSRRTALLGGAAALTGMLGGLAPRAADAATLLAPGAQAPGFFRFSMGEATITVISDGNLTIPTDGFGVNADRAEVEAFLTSRFLDASMAYSHTNLTLIEIGAAKILADIGSGDRFQDSAGKAMANLAAAGVDPTEITHLVMTHAHPDHIWGVYDEFEEAPRIVEAEHSIAAVEYDWWMKEGRVDEVPDAMKAFVIGAENSLKPIAERTRMLQDGEAVAPGVTVRATPGHTPGHISLMVESGGQKLIVLGDSMSHAYASFEKPGWYNGFDMDGPKAVETREALLKEIVDERIAMIGYHFPFPGVGHAAKFGEAYRYIPADWRWAG